MPRINPSYAVSLPSRGDSSFLAEAFVCRFWRASLLIDSIALRIDRQLATRPIAPIASAIDVSKKPTTTVCNQKGLEMVEVTEFENFQMKISSKVMFIRTLSNLRSCARLRFAAPRCGVIAQLE